MEQELITISDNKKTKLKRKLFFDFALLQRVKQIKIRCYIFDYNEKDERVISSEKNNEKDIILDNNIFVSVEDGHVLTEEELLLIKPDEKKTTQYDYYNELFNSVGIYNEVEKIIKKSDSSGFFNN